MGRFFGVVLISTLTLQVGYWILIGGESAGSNKEETCENCEMVCISVSQEVLGQSIVWPETVVGERASSSPPCLDSNFRMMFRWCHSDGWGFQPNCSFLQNKLSRCPDNFTYLETSDICYTITDSKQFSPECPFEDPVPFKQYIGVIPHDNPIWVPVYRNFSSNSIGRLEWTEASDLYGEEVDMDYTTEDDELKNCLIYVDSIYKAVSCDEQYSTVCAYRPLQSQENNYCQQKLNNPDCFPSDFGATTSCFCINNLESATSRSKVCESYAEFIYPYQNIFPDSQICWIGLEKDSESYIWYSSKQPITYSAWSSHTLFHYKYGAVRYTSDWILTRSDANLSCGICEETLSSNEWSSLHLRYDSESKKLILTAMFPENLKIMDTDGNHVKCFTDTDALLFKAKHPDFYTVEPNEKYTTYRYNASESGPGYYWCEAFLYPSLELVRSNAILVYDRSQFGNEYVLWLIMTYTDDATVTKAAALLTSAFSKLPNGSRLVKSIREMKILDFNEEERYSRVIVHITSEVTTGYDREKEYEEMQDVVNTVIDSIAPNVNAIEKFLTSDFCYKSVIITEDDTLNFDSTDLGYSATPNEICITQNGTLARRNCEGNFIEGAYWGEFNEVCSNSLQRSDVTDDLNELLGSNHTVENIITNLTQISEQYERLEVIDIFLISRILRQISNEDVDLQKTATVISNIVNSNRTVLMSSQNNLNSTNDILYHFDRIMMSSQVLNEETHVKIEENNIIILIADILHDIRGIFLTQSDMSIKAEIAYRNTSWQEILDNENLIAAIMIPFQLIQQLETALDAPKLIITVFMKDSLFNEESESKVADLSKIFGVIIPDFHEDFKAPIQMIFRAEGEDRNKTCGYWKFKSSIINSESSAWVSDGTTALLTNRSDALVLCQFWHATHFAMLVLNDDSLMEFNPDLKRFLDITTDINCALSLFGLAGILLTALLFKSWRRNTGNQVLINFVFAISLQIVLLYVSAKVKDATTSTVLCICVGALLHYSVVSEFCWMLVIAILQFKRFVQVFGGPPKWVLVKACFTGWVVPLMPVIVLVAVSPENYTAGRAGLCYPSQMGFYLALLLPISLVLAANVIIYIVILSDVFYKKADTSHCINTELVLQWRLVVLLFFMLGITWTFALLAYAYDSAMFTVLFCFTATLQGFILFMFFIVFNKSTRLLYVKLFKGCWYRL